MAQMFDVVTVHDDRLTVSRLVWRRHRAHMPGLVEAILAANPGLAAAGPFIPPGTRVSVPVIEQASGAGATPAPLIELW